MQSDSAASIMLWLKLVPSEKSWSWWIASMTGIPHHAGDQLRPSFVGSCSADEEDSFVGHRDVIPREYPQACRGRHVKAASLAGTGEPAQPYSLTSSFGWARFSLPERTAGVDMAASRRAMLRLSPGYRVEDDLAVLVMDHLAPCSGLDLRSREWVEGVLIDVVPPRTVVMGER